MCVGSETGGTEIKRDLNPFTTKYQKHIRNTCIILWYSCSIALCSNMGILSQAENQCPPHRRLAHRTRPMWNPISPHSGSNARERWKESNDTQEVEHPPLYLRLPERVQQFCSMLVSEASIFDRTGLGSKEKCPFLKVTAPFEVFKNI